MYNKSDATPVLETHSRRANKFRHVENDTHVRSLGMEMSLYQAPLALQCPGKMIQFSVMLEYTNTNTVHLVRASEVC